MKCPECNTENNKDAFFCENCSHRFKSKTNGWAILFAVLFVITGVFAIYFYSEAKSQGYRNSSHEYENNNIRNENNNNKDNEINNLTNEISRQKSEIANLTTENSRLKNEIANLTTENSNNSNNYNSNTNAFPNESRIKNFINNFNQYISDNNFQGLKELYAPTVKRYHDTYNQNRKDVIERYKRYDKVFGVYGKRSEVRWNTLQIVPQGENLVYIQYIDDYSIDRYDKNNYSKFVLEKHIELNRDYQVVSIYDIQLSKQ
jgi:archaellum component FlaC